MLWWLIGLWLCSPGLLPILWLFGRLQQTLAERPREASPTERSPESLPGD
jgi:hypothetical protein